MSAVIERQDGVLTRVATSERVRRTTAGRIRDAVLGPTGLLVGLTAIGSTFLYWLVHRALIDDSYITLTYARTLADHGQWGMLPGHQADSATSPLNVLLLGGLTMIFGNPVVALGVLYVLTCVALALALRGLGHTLGLGYRVAAFGTPLLVASPLLASTIGLETMMVVTAMTFLAWACARGDATMAGLVAGVLLWLRLDTVVVAGILVLGTPLLWRRLIRVGALAVAVVLPWLVFSWLALGSAIPDTLLIKQGEPWGNFVTALQDRYEQPYPWAVTGVFVIGGIGLLAALTWPAWRRRGVGASAVVPALTLAGAAYFVLMWQLNVPPFFWYYAPTFAALTLVAVIGLATLSGRQFGAEVRAGATTIGCALIVLSLVPWWTGASTAAPLREMPIHGNWALPGQYAKIGRELHNIVGDTPVRSPGEVGALAYFCRCTIVDRFSDRASLIPSIEQARKDSWLYRLNYDGLDVRTLDPIEPGYWLVWRPGPDPSGRGWNTTGIVGGPRAHGHIALLTHFPGRDNHRPDLPRSTTEKAMDGSLR